MAIPVNFSLPGVNYFVLDSLNLYVRHATQEEVVGPFHLGMYVSDILGNPSSPFGQVTVNSFPYDGTSSSPRNSHLNKV